VTSTCSPHNLQLNIIIPCVEAEVDLTKKNMFV
jgi:hypothetical protein